MLQRNPLSLAQAIQDLFSGKMAVAPLTEKGDRDGEWTCGHGPCPVGRVRLRVRPPFHEHLPRLRCPLCWRTLAFRRWLSAGFNP
jgi:hypothetical protein